MCNDSPPSALTHPASILWGASTPPRLGPSFPGLGLACAMPGPGLRTLVWGPGTPRRQCCDRPRGTTRSQLTRGALEVHPRSPWQPAAAQDPSKSSSGYSVTALRLGTEAWLAGAAMSSPPPVLLRHLLKFMSSQMEGWKSPTGGGREGGGGQGNPVAITSCSLRAAHRRPPILLPPSEATSLPL